MVASANKGYEEQVTGTNAGTWGSVLNSSVIDFVDSNMGARFDLVLAASPVVLSAAEGRNLIIYLSGTLGAAVQITNPNVGFYLIENLTSGAFDVTLTNGVGSPITIPQNYRAVIGADTTNGVRIFSLVSISNPQVTPAGSTMVFMQTSVPAGWTLDSTLNDYTMQLSSTTAGTKSGSVAFSTLFARTATDGTALTTAQIPAHDHDMAIETRDDSAQGQGFDFTQGWWLDRITVHTPNVVATSLATGSGTAHTHAVDLRVKAVTGVVGVRGS